MKTCTIYYATVIETEGEWARKNEKYFEPMQVEDRPPLGKVPEFCCEEIKKAIDRWSLSIGGEAISISGRYEPVKINFCPFCGAKIVYISDLKLKAIKYTKSYDSYYFEEA